MDSTLQDSQDRATATPERADVNAKDEGRILTTSRD